MEECFYFVGNILVQVRHIFLPNYFLVLTLLKLKGVWGILEQKKKKSVQIEKAPYIVV